MQDAIFKILLLTIIQKNKKKELPPSFDGRISRRRDLQNRGILHLPLRRRRRLRFTWLRIRRDFEHPGENVWGFLHVIGIGIVEEVRSSWRGLDERNIGDVSEWIAKIFRRVVDWSSWKSPVRSRLLWWCCGGGCGGADYIG